MSYESKKQFHLESAGHYQIMGHTEKADLHIQAAQMCVNLKKMESLNISNESNVKLYNNFVEKNKIKSIK